MLATFRICDAYHPPAHELLKRLFGDQILRGHVTALSDNSEGGGSFVALEVERLPEPIIVRTSDVIEWLDE